jgi:hypothetical protein
MEQCVLVTKANMLSFLSREKSNVKKVTALKRSAKEKISTKRIKQSVIGETGNVAKKLKPEHKILNLPPVLQKDTSFDAASVVAQFKELNPQYERDAKIPVSMVIDVDGDVDEIVHPIPLQVQVAMNGILKNLELRSNKKSSSGKIKFVGRVKKPFLTWRQRANVIYFHLHPAFANKDLELTSYVFELPETTIKGWLYENRYLAKWLAFVKGLKPFELASDLPDLSTSMD